MIKCKAITLRTDWPGARDMIRITIYMENDVDNITFFVRDWIDVIEILSKFDADTWVAIEYSDWSE